MAALREGLEGEKTVQDMIETLKLVPSLIDGCTVGVKSKKTGKPIKKPWNFMNDSPEMQRLMKDRCCKHGAHEHEPCEGAETTATGFYPEELAQLIVNAFRREDTRKRAQEAVRQRDADRAQYILA